VARLFESEPQIREIPVSADDQAVSDLMTKGDFAYAIQGHEGSIGYVFSTSAKGRYDYFDYSVIFSNDLSVLSVLVTTYRSTHGAGICSKGWLKQFEGYHGEEIRLGKEVDAISGSTISATSMVEDIRRCYLVMEALSKGGRLH
jgi:Na+-translocating ferredoxin:NAD+ oxidoreductase RnfG subunit